MAPWIHGIYCEITRLQNKYLSHVNNIIHQIVDRRSIDQKNSNYFKCSVQNKLSMSGIFMLLERMKRIMSWFWKDAIRILCKYNGYINPWDIPGRFKQRTEVTMRALMVFHLGCCPRLITTLLWIISLNWGMGKEKHYSIFTCQKTYCLMKIFLKSHGYITKLIKYLIKLTVKYFIRYTW
jgi:hypothetical protein